jgi:DnaJ homolog subfamily C member 8
VKDDAERAQQAFEIINKAWKTLENEETRKKCMYIVEEAKERTDHMVFNNVVLGLRKIIL